AILPTHRFSALLLRACCRPPPLAQGYLPTGEKSGTAYMPKGSALRAIFSASAHHLYVLLCEPQPMAESFTEWAIEASDSDDCRGPINPLYSCGHSLAVCELAATACMLWPSVRVS